MSGPWEDFQPQAAAVPPAAEDGPWQDFAPDPDALAQAQAAPITDLAPVKAEVDYGRIAELGGRSIAQGLASVADGVHDSIRKLPTMQLYDWAMGHLPSLHDVTAAALTQQGVAKPETKGERIGVGVGEAVTGAATTLGAGAAGGVRFLKANPVLQLTGAATGAGAAGLVRENGGSPMMQTLAALAAGLAPAGVRAGVPAAVRGAVRGGETSRLAMLKRIADFDAAGTTPTVGQATQRRAIQGVESTLGRLPGSAGVIARKAEQQGQEIGAGVRRTADRLAPGADSISAGRAITRGVNGPGGFMERTGAQQEALYGKVDAQIDPASRVAVEGTADTLGQLNADIPGAPELSKQFRNARIAGIGRALAADTEGEAAALTRPEVKREADAIRSRLQEQADRQRARLAEQASEQRADLVAQNESRRAELVAESERLRGQIHDAVENRRLQLYREADELEVHLREQQRAAIEENSRRSMFPETRSQLMQVLSDDEIARQVPTRTEIDARLPSKADIDAQVPSAQDIEAQLLSDKEIERRVLSPSQYNDPAFGAEYIDKQVSDYLKSQADGRLPYEAVQKTRTLVGREIADAGIAPDVPRSKWNPLYGALSDDMKAAADDAGPEARVAWNRANRYTRAKAERQDAIAHVVDRDGGPEMIFKAAMSGTKEGATTLRALMRSLPEGSQRQVAAAVLNRMGKAVDSVQNAEGTAFSTQTFLRNWNTLSKEARAALFDRFGPEFREQVDAITRTADNLNSGSRIYANPSGTAAATAQIGGLASLLTAVGTGNVPVAAGVVGGGVTANLMARLLTNPRSAAWLAERTPVPYSAINGLRYAGEPSEDRED